MHGLENAVEFIGPEADDACVKAETEAQTGLISGSRGTGPVSSKLQTLCVRKTSMEKALQETIAAAEPMIAQIRMLSRELDLLVLDTGKTLSEREILFIEKARGLEGLLEDLRSTDRMRSIGPHTLMRRRIG